MGHGEVSIRVYKPHWRAGPTPAVDGQHEINSVIFLFRNFTFLIFCLFFMVPDFVFMDFFSVCIYISHAFFLPVWFLKRDKWWMDPDGRTDGDNLGGVERGDTLIRINYELKTSILNNRKIERWLHVSLLILSSTSPLRYSQGPTTHHFDPIQIIFAWDSFLLAT